MRKGELRYSGRKEEKRKTWDDGRRKRARKREVGKDIRKHFRNKERERGKRTCME